jgi:hypothetical protein
MDAYRENLQGVRSDHLKVHCKILVDRRSSATCERTPEVSLIGMSVLNLYEKVNRSLGLIFFSLDVPPYDGVFRAHGVSDRDRGDESLRTRSFLHLDLDTSATDPDPAPLHTVTFLTKSYTRVLLN